MADVKYDWRGRPYCSVCGVHPPMHWWGCPEDPRNSGIAGYIRTHTDEEIRADTKRIWEGMRRVSR